MKVGSQTLANYSYDYHNRLETLDYSNGDRVEYTYDEHSRLIQETYEDGETVTYTYDAWGNPGPVGGSLADTLEFLNPLRYRGYVYDTETGLYYLQSRYYNPQTGRFINADDIAYLGADGALTGYNLFVYCNNNPIMGYDPAGYWNWGGNSRCPRISNRHHLWNSRRCKCICKIIFKWESTLYCNGNWYCSRNFHFWRC